MAQPPTHPSLAAQQGDDRRAIYEQDMEAVRFRYAAKWSRFQAVSVIEGAALYASFQGGLTRPEGVLVMIGATLLIGLAFLLVLTDERVITAYLNRACAFEDSAGASPHSGNFSPVIPMNPTRIVMGGILLFNAVVVVRLALWPAGL